MRKTDGLLPEEEKQAFDSYVVCFNFTIQGQNKYSVVINCVQKNNYNTTHVTDVAGLPDRISDIIRYVRRQSLNLAASGIFDAGNFETNIENRSPKLYLAINDTEHQFNNAFEVRNLAYSYYYWAEAVTQLIPCNERIFNSYIEARYQ